MNKQEIKGKNEQVARYGAPFLSPYVTKSLVLDW